MAHARFEPLMLLDDQPDLRRRRLLTSGLLAATVCMAAGMTTWLGDKMGISAVAPPKNTYAVAFEVLTTPPPPAPPPAVGRAEAAATTPATADERQPPKPEVAPLDVPELRPDPKPRAAPTRAGGPATGGGIGVPNGVHDGVPHGLGTAACLIPPCLGTQVVADPAIAVREQADAPVQAPFASVAARSIYTPDPDQTKLARTPTALRSRRPGKTTVAFCIDGAGRTKDVRVKKAFGGDPEVDGICRQTVARWRFHPQKVQGKARTTCSSVTFDIRFD